MQYCAISKLAKINFVALGYKPTKYALFGLKKWFFNFYWNWFHEFFMSIFRFCGFSRIFCEFFFCVISRNFWSNILHFFSRFSSLCWLFLFIFRTLSQNPSFLLSISYIYTKTSKNTKPPYPSGFWLILQCFLCVLRRSLDVIHSMFNVIFNSINHFTLKFKKNFYRKLNSRIF